MTNIQYIKSQTQLPEKYKGDVARLANKYAAVGANAFSFSY